MKQRTCRACKCKYTPVRPMQSACSLHCAAIVGKAKREQKDRADIRARNKLDRIRREEMKTKPELTKEAQIAFNRYIRLRDAGRDCICCGRPLGAGDIGGGFDAGHYRSIGSAPHLRFEPDNCHAQSKQCNRWGAGRAVDYRIGLIRRIGSERVEALEADNAPRHWTRDELRAIRDEYRAKANLLAKEVSA